MPSDAGAALSRKGSLLGTVKAVCWSFVGLRKRSDFEQDGARLNPLQIILVRGAPGPGAAASSIVSV